MNNELTSDRNQDVLTLCKAVLKTSVKFFDNPNGAYENSCPFCRTMTKSGSENPIAMHELKHKPNCAWLIAKDLSTGLI